MKPLSRRALVACLCVLLWPVLAAAQQNYPTRAIHLISPYAPGGGNDIMARLLGQRLTESLGQQVLVENRPGGNTVIGTDALAKSAPDGYTLLLVGTDHVLVPQLLKVPYDPIKDFSPVATLASGELALVLTPLLPANNLQEFIALAKSRPGQLNYATYGSGSTSHLASELFSMMVGVKMQHIPYKGAGPAITDLVGGQVQLFFATSASVVAHIKAGKIKAIAISGETRKSALPDVSTFTESGLPGFDVTFWYSVLAPAGTPKEIVDKLSTQIARTLALPDYKEKLAAQGVEPFISTPEQFAALLRADMAKYAKVIKAADIRFEN
jgi:tripartite-type tricarboxylate transporter receptor subunit TctC